MKARGRSGQHLPQAQQQSSPQPGTGGHQAPQAQRFQAIRSMQIPPKPGTKENLRIQIHIQKF